MPIIRPLASLVWEENEVQDTCRTSLYKISKLAPFASGGIKIFLD